MDRTLRVVLSVFGVIIAAPIVLYAAMLVLNWNDEPPSADALAFASALRDSSDVADADNAYVYMLGFAARRNKDPTEVGAARAAWIRAMRADPSLTRESDPYPSLNGFGNFYEQLASIRCDPDAACYEKLAAAHDKISALIARQPLVLERYRNLLAHRAWADVTTGDTRNTWFELSPVSSARILYLLEAWSRAEAGDAAAVRDSLDADLNFWRLALRESSSLFAKDFIEQSIIRQHFLWGNLILRRVPGTVRETAIPTSWRRPLSDDERSMAAPFRAEWDYARRFVLNAKKFGDPFATRAPPLRQRVFTAIFWIPFLQPQSSANRDAAAFVRLEALLAAPYDELPAALDRADSVVDERPIGVIDTFYDLAGGLLVPHRRDFADYGARVADLEGVRRAALLTAELRARGVPADGVAAALAEADSRNPYTGEPFEWIDASGSIGVTGIQRSTYKHTEFPY